MFRTFYVHLTSTNCLHTVFSMKLYVSILHRKCRNDALRKGRCYEVPQVIVFCHLVKMTKSLLWTNSQTHRKGSAPGNLGPLSLPTAQGGGAGRRLCLHSLTHPFWAHCTPPNLVSALLRHQKVNYAHVYLACQHKQVCLKIREFSLKTSKPSEKENPLLWHQGICEQQSVHVKGSFRPRPLVSGRLRCVRVHTQSHTHKHTAFSETRLARSPDQATAQHTEENQGINSSYQHL